MKSGESADAYNARIAAYNASTPDAPTAAPTTDPAQDAVIRALQGKIESAAGAVSSATSNIESTVNNAIRGTQSATDMGRSRIESQFGRESSYAVDNAKRNFQNFSESRTGFGTQMAAFRNLVQTTDKEMKDLDMRREELILANDSAGAQRVADLQMKALEFKQKAAQDTFNNILQTGAFALQASAEQRAGREFTANLQLNRDKLNLDILTQKKNEEAQMASIAAEFGVELKPGDSMADVVTRVAPMANSIKRAQLNQLLAETAKINKEFDNEKTTANFQVRVAELIGQGATPGEATKVALDEAIAFGIQPSKDMYDSTIKFAIDAKAQQDLEASKKVSETSSTLFRSLPDLISGIEGGVSGGYQTIEDWLTGNNVTRSSGGGSSF